MTHNRVTLVDTRARVVFPSDSPTAYTDLADEVDRLNADYVELARAIGVDGTDHPHALAAARAAVIDANAWADGHPMLKQMVAEVERLNAKDAALTAEVLDLRAKLSQMADDAVKVMANSLRDVEEMREHLASKDVHCPGTDSDCPRACTTNLCEIMVEREKSRHGCG